MSKHLENLYICDNEDITQLLIAQTRAVLNIIMEKEKIDFPDAMIRFFDSNTHRTLMTPTTYLWAESPQYIANFFYEYN